MSKQITITLNVSLNLIVATVVATTIFFAYNIIFAWTGPTATPPSGNVPAPINVSSTAQTKTGDLNVNNFGVFGTLAVNDPTTGKLGVKLEGSTGKVDAAQYCDQKGKNCSTPADISTVINKVGTSTGGTSGTPFIHLYTINAETSGNISTANKDCKNAGYGGVWAAEDRSGTEPILCYVSNISGIDTPVPKQCTVTLTSVMSKLGTTVTTIQMPEGKKAAIGAYIGTGSNPPPSPYVTIKKQNYNSGNWNAQRYDQSLYWTTQEYSQMSSTLDNLNSQPNTGYYTLDTVFTVKANTSYSVKHPSVDGASGTVTVTADIGTCVAQ